MKAYRGRVGEVNLILKFSITYKEIAEFRSPSVYPWEGETVTHRTQGRLTGGTFLLRDETQVFCSRPSLSAI
jgi:hypothetical protein